jgi:subtilisin family serine protease
MKKDILSLESLENRSLLTPVIAIIDSGMDINHEALKGYIWKNPGEIVANNIDDDHNGYIDDVNGWNFADNNNIVTDGYGHGTHVGGVVSSYGPVSIMVLKFQNNSGIGDTGGAIKSIDYIVMMKKDFGVDIVAINNSWGGGIGRSSLLEGAITRAAEVNIAFVVAAGNSGSDNDLTPRYPSSYPQDNVIAVAAVGYDNATLAGFSNYGKNSVDLAARGTVIYSTLPGNRYGYMSGTSMAAPQVSGAIAAICNKYGNLSVSEIKNKIFSSINKSVGLADKVYSGGSLNITGALGDESFKVIAPSLPVIVKSWNERMVGRVDIMNINRVRGWTLDSEQIHDRVRVKVLINDRVVSVADANRYRNDLRSWGDGNHGFDFRLNRRMFVRGWNEVKVMAENKDTGELKVIGFKRIRRII